MKQRKNAINEFYVRKFSVFNDPIMFASTIKFFYEVLIFHNQELLIIFKNTNLKLNVSQVKIARLQLLFSIHSYDSPI
jgi:hypothetical protein